MLFVSMGKTEGGEDGEWTKKSIQFWIHRVKIYVREVEISSEQLSIKIKILG